MMIVTKEKILFLTKTIKSFTETQKVSMIKKKNQIKNNDEQNEMIIDDDNLEYAHSEQNFIKGKLATEKNKKPAFSLYEIKI
jgi:hypothetical protein